MAKAIPGARYVEFPGTTHSVGPNLDRMVGTVREFVTGQRAPAPTSRRLLTILFMDVVGSTERAVELGDAAWRELLAARSLDAAKLFGAFEGREIDRAGDGLVAVFEGPTRAIRCARAIQDDAREHGLELRGGIHTGEVEDDGEAIRGIAVHIAARLCAIASEADLLVSSTVRDLTAGAGLEYEDRGLRRVERRPGSAPSLRGAKLTPLRDVGDQPDHQRTDEQVTAHHGFGWELRFASWCGVRSEWPTAGLRPVTAQHGGRRVRWSGGMRGSMVGWRGRCVC